MDFMRSKRMRRITALLLAGCLISELAPVASVNGLSMERTAVLCYAAEGSVADTGDSSFAAVGGDVTYEIIDGAAVITGCEDTVTEISIPGELDGYPVTGISRFAFYSEIYGAKKALPPFPYRIV